MERLWLGPKTQIKQSCIYITKEHSPGFWEDFGEGPRLEAWVSLDDVMVSFGRADGREFLMGNVETDLLVDFGSANSCAESDAIELRLFDCCHGYSYRISTCPASQY